MTKRDRIVLGALAVVALLAGFYLGVAKPKTSEVADLDQQIIAAQDRRDAALTELRTAAAARAQYQKDQRTLAVLGKAVPADDGVPSVLYQLHKAARKSGITFDSVTVGANGTAAGSTGGDATPGTVPGPSGLSMLPLTIEFSGTFFNVDKLLREVHRFAAIGEEKIEVRGRLLTIDSIDLKPVDEGNSSRLDVTLVVNAYVAPKEQDGTAATASGTGTTDAAAATTPGDDAGSGAGTTETTPTPSTGVPQ